ncbi:MAG TPA: prepilin-type N-terminal cleavage/methylation domain-containing protein [Candidatus Methylacidiphilales bacterium]
MRSPFPRRGFRGFTLIELLVAVAVLALLVALAVGVVGGTAKAILSSNKRQDADGQARTALDRIGADIANAVRRADLDAIFPKAAGNDRMFFHSEAPAYFDASNALLFPGSSASDPKSILSLVGYRIEGDSGLERLGLGLTWAGKASGSGSGAAVYLSRVAGSGVIDPASTLSGAWPAAVGQPPNYDGSDATYWRVLSPQVFRMETCFLLKDGTLSVLPVLRPSGKTNNLGAQAPPTAASDAGAGYVPGSRWFDAAAQRGYVCVDNTAGAAVWNAVGTGDLAAVVVALAILDASSRQTVPASALRAVALALPDAGAGDLAASPPRLMKRTWQAVVQAPSFAQSSGLPPEAAARVRVYQRYFYLNSP